MIFKKSDTIGALPLEPSRPSSWRQLVTMLMVMASVVMVANLAAIALISIAAPNLGYWVVDQKWELLRADQEPVDWLILGDSSCNQAVDPALLAQHLGGRALNLCTTGDMLLVEGVWMLQDYIARHGPPGHVIIVHVFHIWPRDAQALRQTAWNITSNPGFFEGLQPELTFTFREALEHRSARHLPLYSQPASLRALLAAPTLLQRPRPTLTPMGYMPVHDARPDHVRHDSAGHLAAIQAQPPEISDINRQALQVLAELADRHQINVSLALPPTHDALAAEPAFKDHLFALNALLHDAVPSANRLRFVMTEPVPFPDVSMENSDHLIATSVPVYTQLLAESVRVAW